MPLSTRDLLASVLGEAQDPLPAMAAPAQQGQLQALPRPAAPPCQPGPWRVTAQASGGRVQITNACESRLVRKQELELYLRGHGHTRPITS
jgi:hypothetical protein